MTDLPVNAELKQAVLSIGHSDHGLTRLLSDLSLYAYACDLSAWWARKKKAPNIRVLRRINDAFNAINIKFKNCVSCLIRIFH